MSKLLEIYKKSPFSELGKKVSNIHMEKSTDSSKIGTPDIKSIIDVQRDFYDLVIKPYKTILEHHSSMGDIAINPKVPILDLFSTVNNNISPVVISDKSSLITMIPTIHEFETGNLLKKSKITETTNIKSSSVLNYNIPDIRQSTSTENLINSKLIEISNFELSNILKLNSNFNDIVNLKISSVLNKKSEYSDVIDLPYSNVLGLNTKFDDLVIKSAGSVLKQYITSGLTGIIPGIANFIDDIYNTGFTLNASSGESFFNLDKIPSISTEMINKEKSTIDVVPMIETPEKVGIDVSNNIETPDKVGKDVTNNIVIPEKVGIDVSNNIITPKKEGKDVTNNIVTPEKVGKDVTDNVVTPKKEGKDVTNNIVTPEKVGKDVTKNYILPDFNAKISQAMTPTSSIITPDKSDTIEQLNEVNFFTDTYNTGFTKYDNYPIESGEYKLDKLPSDAIQQFNFNDSSYAGVLNQYAIYFSKYPPLTSVTYKTVIDWAYNRIVRVPEALDLERKGLHTPTVNIGQTQLITPPYIYANERLPIWANTYVNTLEDVGSTLVSGFLSQRTIDLLGTVVDIDVSSMKQSSLTMQQLAGEVYYNYSNFGTQIRNIREVVLNYTSNLVGYQIANMFIPKVESTIGGLTADLVNNTLNATLLDSDKVLMLYHILMGTKYTKSKAYFDRLAKTYRSLTTLGDNAVNLYNDSVKYNPSDGTEITTKITPNLINSIVDYATGNNITQDAGKSAVSALLNKITDTFSDDTYIPIGLQRSDLINTYLKKSDSFTFGKKDDKKQFIYGDTPSTKSIDNNYPTGDVSSVGATSQDTVNSYLGKTTFDLNDIVGQSSIINTNAGSNRDDSYTRLLQKRLQDAGKLSLDDRGFPSNATNNIDRKNTLPLTKMPSSEIESIGIEKFKDDDLIDFYFEDLSSFSDTGESVLIPFRAIITTISDDVSADWSPQDYVGRADKFWIYQGFNRTIGLTFEIAINSNSEFKSSWNKLNYLQGLCYPVSYPQQISLKAPIVSLTIGNLFDRIQVILTSFSVSFDGSTLWELEKGYQLPMYIKVSLLFTVIFADIPQTLGKHYAQSQNWINPDIYDYTNKDNQTEESKQSIVKSSTGQISSINSRNNIIQSIGNLESITNIGF